MNENIEKNTAQAKLKAIEAIGEFMTFLISPSLCPIKIAFMTREITLSKIKEALKKASQVGVIEEIFTLEQYLKSDYKRVNPLIGKKIVDLCGISDLSAQTVNTLFTHLEEIRNMSHEGSITLIAANIERNVLLFNKVLTMAYTTTNNFEFPRVRDELTMASEKLMLEATLQHSESRARFKV